MEDEEQTASDLEDTQSDVEDTAEWFPPEKVREVGGAYTKRREYSQQNENIREGQDNNRQEEPKDPGLQDQ